MDFYSDKNNFCDVRLNNRLEKAGKRLYEKIRKIDLIEIGISEYNQKYLKQILGNIESTLQRYSYLLSLSLKNAKKSIEEFVLVDYGGGSGLLSMLAVETGIGKVIYNDIYDISCIDIQKLSRAAKINIADFVCGDISELISFLKKKSITINAVVSYDVIEHIYDIEEYFRKLRFLSTGPIRLVLASGANIQNLIYKRKIMKKQLMYEYEDRKLQWGHKERDTLKSYFSIRKEIISKLEPKLDAVKVKKLAYFTRGLIQHDIEKYLKEYKKRNDISYRPEHPTNTCDPYTGNWAEHLMKTHWLEKILKDEGFNVKILSGFWDTTGKLHTRIIKKIQNRIIRNYGRKALFLSPYYVIYANNNYEQNN